MATVDVVIATRERPAALRRSLTALAQQTLPKFGVIVVDDHSTPPINSWLHEADFPTLDLTILALEEHGGPAVARNAGVAASDADYIAFVDDDVEAEPHLLERHLQVAESGDGAWLASIGPMNAPPRWEPQIWSLWEWRQLEAEYHRMIEGVYHGTWRQFHTGNAFVPRAALDAVEGFDPRFTRAEDIELALRLAQAGVAVRFTPGAIVWHSPVRTFKSWRQIASAYGRYDVAIDRMHPDMGWLDRINVERDERHWLMRFARSVPGMTMARPVIGRLASGVAIALGVTGFTRPALAGLSFVYALEYDHGLRTALRDQEWFADGSARPEPQQASPVTGSSAAADSGTTAESSTTTDADAAAEGEPESEPEDLLESENLLGSERSNEAAAQGRGGKSSRRRSRGRRRASSGASGG